MSAEFDDAVQPLRGRLLGVLDASQATRENNGFLPSAASQAMAEIAAEERFQGDWGKRPVESAHSWAGMLIATAENQLRTMCRVVLVSLLSTAPSRSHGPVWR
jgi:hypothetical protein